MRLTLFICLLFTSIFCIETVRAKHLAKRNSRELIERNEDKSQDADSLRELDDTDDVEIQEAIVDHIRRRGHHERGNSERRFFGMIWEKIKKAFGRHGGGSSEEGSSAESVEETTTAAPEAVLTAARRRSMGQRRGEHERRFFDWLWKKVEKAFNKFRGRFGDSNAEEATTETGKSAVTGSSGNEATAGGAGDATE